VHLSIFAPGHPTAGGKTSSFCAFWWDFHTKYLGIFTSKIEKDDGEDIGIQSLLKLHPLEIIDFCFSWVGASASQKGVFFC